MINLLAVGQRYLQFAIDFSQHNLSEAAYAELFSQDCKKVINGRLLCENLEQLRLQFTEVKDEFKSHSIQPLHVIPSDENSLCVVHFTVKTATLAYIVTTILTADFQGKIIEINDVYNEIGAYN